MLPCHVSDERYGMRERTMLLLLGGDFHFASDDIPLLVPEREGGVEKRRENN